MKRYLALLVVLVLLLSGCGAAEPTGTVMQVQPTGLADMPQERPDFAPEDFIGQMHMDPGYSMNRMETGEVTYTPLPSENREELFSQRDLNSAPELAEAVPITPANNSVFTISTEGIYLLTGQSENFTVKVEADKSDKVQIVLRDVSVTNEDFPVIYVKSADKCFVTLLGENQLTVSKQFTSDGDINTDAVIFAKDDLTLNGTGSLTILSAAGNGITCKDDLKLTGGTYRITSALDAVEANDSISVYDGSFTIATRKDGFHCENDEQQGAIYIRSGSFDISAADDGIQATTTLVVDGGEFHITAAEGMEATYVQINDGVISIRASDDGINAARKSSAYDVVIEINGGEITVVMGAGDTDALDANGVIIVNGGIVDLTGNSTFDADRGSVKNGGTIIINGTQVDEIPTSMMGGHGGMGGMKQDRPNGGFGAKRP